MNKIYKVIFCKRTGQRVAVSEVTKSAGKHSGGKAVATVLCSAALSLFTLGEHAFAQTFPEAPCTPNSGGTMYSANPSCVNFVNNTRIYVNSLSTSTSTGLSSVSTGVSSLSTGLSTTNSSVTSLFDLDFDGAEQRQYGRLVAEHRVEHDQ